VLPRLRGIANDRGVGIVWRGDNHGVDTRIAEKLPVFVIDAGDAELARRRLGAVTPTPGNRHDANLIRQVRRRLQVRLAMRPQPMKPN
jgi:hypothetical protein